LSFKIVRLQTWIDDWSVQCYLLWYKWSHFITSRQRAVT